MNVLKCRTISIAICYFRYGMARLHLIVLSSFWGEARHRIGKPVQNQGATPHPGHASARSRIDVRCDNSHGSPGLKGSSLPAGTLSSAMLSTMATVT